MSRTQKRQYFTTLNKINVKNLPVSYKLSLSYSGRTCTFLHVTEPPDNVSKHIVN